MSGFYESVSTNTLVPSSIADAEAARDAAELAQEGAETAKSGAEDARDLALQYKNNAFGYMTSVGNAQTIADTATQETAGYRT